MPVRRGFTSLEFMVAMVVLGIALAGAFPLMIVCSRGIESLELRYTVEGNKKGNWYSPVFRCDVTSTSPIPRQNYGTWYAIPSTDPWAKKLGAVATFSSVRPTDSPSPNIVDDGDAGYASVGSWTTTADPNSFRGHYQAHASQSPATDTAVWTFSNVSPGYYYVLATWHATPNQAIDACYDVFDGDIATPTVTVLVDQTAAPNSSVYQGWRILTTRNFQSGDKKVKVRLTSNADKAVAADGVRIVPISTILSVDKSFNMEAVTVRVKVGS